MRISVRAPIVRVVSRPPAVAVVQRGPQGPAGAPREHVHDQAAPSAEWIVNQNSGVRPAVAVFSTGGVEIEANVVHASLNQVRIYFASPQAGSARCV